MADNMDRGAFVSKYTDEEKDAQKSQIFTIRLNNDEIEQIKKLQVLLSQPKFTTALKQTVEIGATVLHSEQTGKIMDILFKNKQRNRRTGVLDYTDL